MIKYQAQDEEQVVVHLGDWRKLFVPEVQGGFGCERYGGRIGYETASPKGWPLGIMKWKLPQAPHLAADAMQTHISQRLMQANLDPSVAAIIAEEARNITNQGIDNKLNWRRDNYERAQQAEHLEWLNSEPIGDAEAPTCTEGIRRTVEEQMALVFSGDCDMLEKHAFTDIEDMIAGYIGKTMGVMGIQRSALRLMRDATTGRPVAPMQVLQRLSDDENFYAALRVRYPRAVVDAMLFDNINLPRNTGGLISATYLPALHHVQHHVMREHVPDVPEGIRGGPFIQRILRGANYHFMRVYRKRYENTYRE
jgi:hypothetical protein